MSTFYVKDNDVGQTLENILNQLFRELKAGQMKEMDLIAKETEMYHRKSKNFRKS
jgi:hypothetical protein